MQRLFSLLLYLVVLTFIAPVRAEAPELYEEFVEFITGFGKGTHFYSVQMDEEERPFVNIKDLFENWYDMPVTCQPDGMRCQGIRYPEEFIYWIDAHQLQAGSNIEGSETVMYNADELVFKDGNIWLRYDAFPKWIKVNSNWTLFRYGLSIIPEFMTLKQQKVKRVLDRKKYEYQKAEVERIKKVEPRESPSEKALEMKFGGNMSFQKGNPIEKSGFFNLLSDIGKGTLRINSTIDGEDMKPHFDGFRYDTFDLEDFHHMEFGDSHTFTSLLTSSKALKNGFKIETSEATNAAGKFEYWDTFRPETEVDIFKNGLLLYTEKTDKSGNFHLPEQLAAGNDVFMFKLFYPNGQQETRMVRIAPDNSKLLKPGDWNLYGAAGSSDAGSLISGNARVGISDHFSVGAHINRLKGDEYKENALSFDATWRATDNLNFQYEAMLLDNERYQTLSMYYTGLNNQQLIVNMFDVKKPKGAGERILPKSGTIDNLITVDHSASVFQWNLSSALRYLPGNISLFQSATRRLTRQISTKVDVMTTYNKEEKIQSTAALTGFVKIIGGNDLTLTWDTVAQKLAAGTRMRFRDPVDNSWDVSIGLNWSEGEPITKNIGAAWRYKDNLELGMTTDGETYSLQLKWQQTFSNIKRNLAFKHFGSGSVYGKVMSPPDEDGIRTPIEGFKVFADGRPGITNEEGVFQIDGLATDSKIVIRYDNNSLDVSYTLTSDLDAVTLRPGTRVVLTPEIVNSVGFDGVYLAQAEIPENAEIVIFDIKKNREVKSIKLETDGFFITEQLSSGSYELRFTNVENPPQPYKLEIPPGTDWIGGLEVLEPGMSSDLIRK